MRSEKPKRFHRRSLHEYPRGMGALVVFSSFLALSLGPGLLNAYGVYEEEYDRLYDSKDEGEGRSGGAFGSPVVFIGVLQILLANGMGFVGGMSAQRFGPGPSVFMGGLLMAIGLFTASYAREVWQLCLTQGVVFGLGACLTWIPAASAPSSWFDKSRGLATGITHMGLGIGGLVFAPLTRFLLEKTGTQGSLRWLALVMLVGVSVASLGIHSKHHNASEVVVGSARWSKCLDEETGEAFDRGYESDNDVSYEEYRRASRRARRSARSVESIDESPGKLPDEISEKPKHVHFAPDVIRQATLDKLEGREQKPRRLSSTSNGERPSVRRNPFVQEEPKRRSKPVAPKEPTEEGGKSLLKSWRFWFLSLGIGIGQASWYIVLLFMTSICVSVGLDVHNAAIVLGSINGASAVGQFAAGYAADLIGPVNALLAFTFFAAASNVILLVPNLTFHLLLAYSCLCGASIGAADPLAVITGVTQFGRARAASTTGMIYGSVGGLVTIAAPCARLMQLRLGPDDFTPVYCFVIALFFASTVLLALLRLRISRKLFFRA